MRLLNKKAEIAGEQVMWLWSMFLLLIAAGGLALGVTVFYSQEYDVRAIEAETLNSIITNCLTENEVDFTVPAKFYEACGLEGKVLEDYQKTRIKIGICREGCREGEILFLLGSDFESCDFIGKNKNYPKCVKNKIITDKGDKIEVIVGSNHLSGRIYV